ncbi:hypothetical protein [Laspinema palackyanum]|uniref:hypothetical protein n=1 Tax=Laspinema palackyanum TaxID=3231601 RepID=UPI00345D038D|nr:hypothetical protein [Laspinema sp. D2c]
MRRAKSWRDYRQVLLRLLEDREQRYQKLAELQEKITVGIESLDRGEGMDGETMLTQLKVEIERREARQDPS